MQKDQKFSFSWYTAEDLIDTLPENRPLYKDSGLWEIRTHDMDTIILQQDSGETLCGFIIRYLKSLDQNDLDGVLWNLLGRDIAG
ncbi:hypothetical protein SAMN04489761_3467 [Tenacibaculum sp. MAR_2009_124]|uniref:hypothetical protein n=1 Tax=Tenacibaculum sp. MAR_2009_124 TaxID=1250059 RepID=UPI00089B8F1C|nr:hypothetical protein [Tenacibaculum sp. MAR_2009_124]SEC67357.1 hypothetical protein SAMN04489761_3467 [Tenacibaculum sp. MAR_2009_124]